MSMRYRLRTLLIVLTLGPILLSWLLPPLLSSLRQPRGLFKMSVTAAENPEMDLWIQVDAP